MLVDLQHASLNTSLNTGITYIVAGSVCATRSAAWYRLYRRAVAGVTGVTGVVGCGIAGDRAAVSHSPAGPARHPEEGCADDKRVHYTGIPELEYISPATGYVERRKHRHGTQHRSGGVYRHPQQRTPGHVVHHRPLDKAEDAAV